MPSFFCMHVETEMQDTKQHPKQDVQKLLDQVQQLEKERRYPAAMEMAQQAFRKYPNNRAVAVVLGHMLEVCKEYGQALHLYQTVHEETQKAGRSSELGLVVSIGWCLYHLENRDKAEKVFSELNERVKNNPDVMAGLAACRREQGQLDVAEQLALSTLKQVPDHKEALYELAKVHLARKETDKGLKCLEKNIRRTDVHGDSIDLWMETLSDLDRNRYAQDTLEELAKEYPDIVEFVYGFAVLANKAGEISLARPAFLRSMDLSPNNPRIMYELGVMERVAGDIDRSQELIGRALELQPDNPAALRTYGSDLKFAYGDENYKRLNYAAAKFSEYTPIEQLHLHYALAKAAEDVGEMDAAFRHYAIAGAKKRSTEEYNEKEASSLTQIVTQVVTPHNLGLAKQRGCESEVPVFILGMPRSGTSLMEQILSSHPDIFGAGELKFLTGILENLGIGENMGIRLRMGEKDPVFDYDANAPWAERGQKFVEKLEKLADKPYKRIVDKMPGNFNFVGLIHAILPNARIIHSRRHPVETCLSCYRIHFAEGHVWSYNLRELGRFYKRYWNLMKYWREAFPGVMYEVRYEENVADVEGQAKKLIDYLGLEWNDNCLNFYNTDRPVKTASVTQVRKPIYTTSTNRWRKYEKHLGPLIEEIGDLIEEYESEISHLIKK